MKSIGISLIKDIFSNLKNLKELEGWNIENWSFSKKRLTNSQSNFNDFYIRFFDWYFYLNKVLLKNNLAYSGMAYRKAADEIEKRFKLQKNMVCGFKRTNKIRTKNS